MPKLPSKRKPVTKVVTGLAPKEELTSILRDYGRRVPSKRKAFRYHSVKSRKLFKATGKAIGKFFVIHYNKARKGWQVTHLPTRESVVQPFDTEEQAVQFTRAVAGLDGWEKKTTDELKHFEGCCINLRSFIRKHSMSVGAIELVINRLAKGC